MRLFRRKSRRKRSRSNTNSDGDEMKRNLVSETPALAQNVQGNAMAGSTPSRSATMPQTEQGLKKPRTDTTKLQRRQRAYSFDADDKENIATESMATKARQERQSSPRRPRNTAVANDSFASQADLQQVPTLRKQPGGTAIPRKKSSKRRKQDKERAAEVKAMAHLMPVRPATEDWQSGRPVKRETLRHTPSRETRTQKSWQKETLSSDLSLPMAESLHSSLSEDSEHINIKLSAFEALAPRPTFQYALSPRPGSTTAIAGVHRSGSHRKKLANQDFAPEATLRGHKRIDDLADDFSAVELRELMERDQRRRQRQQQRDQERTERRLARRAERVKAEEAAGRESPPNMERGVMGREAVGLGIDPASAVVTSSRRRLTHSSDEKIEEPDHVESMVVDEEPKVDPLRDFHRTESIPQDVIPPHMQDGYVPPADQAHIHPLLRPQKSHSRSPPLVAGRSTENVATESMRRTSVQDSSQSPSRGRRWSALFKWGNNRPKRYSGEPPSSFSNTSRDSMSVTMMAAPAVPLPINVPRKMSVGVPRRTGSRFREDLPETPITPPHSRLQSPEADILPASIPEQESPDVEMSSPVLVNTTTQEETPTSSLHSAATPPARQHANTHTPQLQSVSMASIDSEGSWLSSSLSNKRRTPTMMVHPPQAHGSPHKHRHQPSGGSAGLKAVQQGRDSIDDEGASITEDEYLARFSPNRMSGSQWAPRRKSSGEARPSSDEDEEARWGTVEGPHLAAVHKPSRGLVKSQEGLLNRFKTEDANSSDDDAGSTDGLGRTEDEQETKIQRATSVDLSRGHARHISAGSAKLLDIPRSPADPKRSSLSRSPS